MAKQTFTTGSVLTATQMNNLQANDYNWTVSQKTANYVLVAADAGTRIEMNTASNTTVTVNTGLFSAGDTLFIQNIGSGSCVITAGTATVQKAATASLTLAQYQGGYLYFVSASNAVFFADAGFTSPLTTKGDLFTWDTGNARLAVGTNGQYLSADSTAATGLKWATVSAAKSFSLLNAGGTALTGANAITISSIGGYDQYYVLISGASCVNASELIGIRINSDSASNYSMYGLRNTAATSYANTNFADRNTNSTAFIIGDMSSNAASIVSGGVFINGANTSGVKLLNGIAGSTAAGGTDARQSAIFGYWNNSALVTSISVTNAGGSNFDAGTVYIYGAA